LVQITFIKWCKSSLLLLSNFCIHRTKLSCCQNRLWYYFNSW